MSAPDSSSISESSEAPLSLRLDVEAVKGELALPDPKDIGTVSDVDPELDRKAQELADKLLDFKRDDLSAQDEARIAVEAMGRELQSEAAHRSTMLKQPIGDLARNSEDGGQVAKGLVDLKLEIEELVPHRFDFSPGWFSRLLGMIPGVGTPIKRYFTKFESSQTVIDAIMRSLESGSEQLGRDNITLREDQRLMRELSLKLERQIALGQLLDAKLQHKLENDIPADDPRHKFVQEELLFPLRQRIIDLQQQLAVNQQGVLSTAIILGNNKELIRGVERALDVTVSALQVAVTVALALINQKIVLEKVQAVGPLHTTLRAP